MARDDRQIDVLKQSKRSAEWRLQTIKSNSLDGKKRSKANFVWFCCCPWTSGGVNPTRPRVCASTWSGAKSSSNCKENDCNSKTRSEANTSKWRGHEILCYSPRTLQLENASSSLSTRIANTPGTDLQTVKAQTTGPERNFIELSDLKQL